MHAGLGEILEGFEKEAQEVQEEAENAGEYAVAGSVGVRRVDRGACPGSGFVLLFTAGTFIDGIALLDKLACIVIFRSDSLLNLPVMAQGGDGLLFRLLALGAGQELGAGEGAGGGGGAGFGPLMGARGDFRSRNRRPSNKLCSCL